MKICIPVLEDRQFESREYDHFGRAPFFAMIDTESNALEIVPNTDDHNDHHEDHHLGLLKSHNIEAVICSGIGRRAVAALAKAGIGLLTPPERTVANVIEAIRAGKGRPLTAEQACGGGRHQHGEAGHGRRSQGHDRGTGAGRRHGMSEGQP
jgi:predicted Fe-Mo cluster-binding NifX family protein